MTDERDILELAERLKKASQPFAMATVVRTVDTTSAKPGAKAVVDGEGVIRGWIGGGCAQPAVRRAARQALGDGKSRLIRVSPEADGTREDGVECFRASCHSGGTLDIFIEPMLPPPALLIIGASPAGRALAGFARQAGYAVTAACAPDDLKLYRGADRLIEGFDLGASAGDITGFVVVATQGRSDRPGLLAALSTGAEYIAFIASRRKAAKEKRLLIESGADPERVAAIRAPAGLDIGAVTPEEIALSILAEIVRERRRTGARAREAAADAAPEPGVIESKIVAAPPPECCGDDPEPH